MFLIVACIAVLMYSLGAEARPSESERVRLWREAGNVWPPKWHDESPGYKANMAAREKEIMSIPGADERWENWMQFTQGQLVPKFTKFGFKLRQTPANVQAMLKAELDKALEDWDGIPTENDVDAIYGPLRPKFVFVNHMVEDILQELKPIHEEWIGGTKLVGTSAYGIRIYQNGSSLIMHHDKVHTHVISSIIHIGHLYDNDNEPWPIQIEDHDGNMHAVDLEPGQMIFYESAKCLHGRMKAFRGKYYAAIFVHYMPAEQGAWHYDNELVIASVPPHWNRGLIEDSGSRWAGQGLTVDSLAPDGAPSRVVRGQYIHDNISPHAHYPSRSEL